MAGATNGLARLKTAEDIHAESRRVGGGSSRPQAAQRRLTRRHSRFRCGSRGRRRQVGRHIVSALEGQRGCPSPNRFTYAPSKASDPSTVNLTPRPYRDSVDGDAVDVNRPVPGGVTGHHELHVDARDGLYRHWEIDRKPLAPLNVFGVRLVRLKIVA